MVEVFKTNVQEAHDAEILIKQLKMHLPNHKINFDLEDCDKILRVEGEQLMPEKVIHIMQTHSYVCTVLQ